MKHTSSLPSASHSSTRLRHTIIAAALITLASGVQAKGIFDKPDTDFNGRVMVMDAAHPGSTITVNGRGFKPGQQLQLLSNGQPITVDPVIRVDEKGGFKANVNVPKDAPLGLHPVVVQVSNPSAADIFEFKISPNVPLSGADKFSVKSEALNPGLYQSAYSAKSNAVYVTASVGRPPVKESSLMKVDPESLKITASVKPAVDPSSEPSQVFAVYGVGVDDEAGTIWTTNTRASTVAVYKQSDLSLLKQFDKGTADHARDVVIDTQRKRAYVSAVTDGSISVFDTEKLQPLDSIALKTRKRSREAASPMGLALDAKAGKLYAVSGTTNEVFVIDLDRQAVEKTIDLPGAKDASGVAVASDEQLLFVAAQDSDNLLIVDLKDGSVKHTVTVGAGPLNVVWEPVKKLAYVASRADGSVAVVSPDGKLVANLTAGNFANHLSTDGKGNVFVVNKGRGPDDKTADHITRYTVK